MRVESGRTLLRRRLLTGFVIGLAVTAFNALFFFMLLDSVREYILGILSTAMEPLLLATPLSIAGLCLVGYLLTLIFPGRH
ncbi:MAG: hypothetical protein ACM3WU_09405 [Bacillota bacterium]